MPIARHLKNSGECDLSKPSAALLHRALSPGG
eukprot:CAMPEP_0175912500 /NCGR_PEP_ID=MMETSP0108-20121206/8761_1 /TAXON_ID=195067 ORGANISM="Goniomonas pacifica, Strain CCMP1869" /NCGR_SAMPLE_ID=MMETSP0108 /ASSEMBLY_ACC=CAM_ASM_000204 /LENGTH=31 /DNA_ID= /DNA_START= /DNA_END= /DNA_ORIENTATION=